MDRKFEKTDNSKDKNKTEGSEILLFASAYSTNDAKLLKPINSKGLSGYNYRIASGGTSAVLFS